jgi:hypothetical protein
MGAAMYAGGPTATPDASSGSGSDGSRDDDDVVDAEVIDEDDSK